MHLSMSKDTCAHYLYEMYILNDCSQMQSINNTNKKCQTNMLALIQFFYKT